MRRHHKHGEVRCKQCELEHLLNGCILKLRSVWQACRWGCDCSCVLCKCERSRDWLCRCQCLSPAPRPTTLEQEWGKWQVIPASRVCRSSALCKCATRTAASGPTYYADSCCELYVWTAAQCVVVAGAQPETPVQSRPRGQSKCPVAFAGTRLCGRKETQRFAEGSRHRSWGMYDEMSFILSGQSGMLVHMGYKRGERVFVYLPVSESSRTALRRRTTIPDQCPVHLPPMLHRCSPRATTINRTSLLLAPGLQKSLLRTSPRSIDDSQASLISGASPLIRPSPSFDRTR